MTNKGEIIKSINRTVKPVSAHIDYSKFPGVYAFILNDHSTLKEFGRPNGILYVGIAKDSLADRDLGNHFNRNSTGRSTLRRSIGSILKVDFDLKVFSRNGTNNKREILNYVFNIEGDINLTDWMKSSLVVGYWEDKNKIQYTQLRELEEQVIKFLKPTLDLDNRTKKYNLLANKLDHLREICRIEAAENAKRGLTRKTYGE